MNQNRNFWIIFHQWNSYRVWTLGISSNVDPVTLFQCVYRPWVLGVVPESSQKRLLKDYRQTQAIIYDSASAGDLEHYVSQDYREYRDWHTDIHICAILPSWAITSARDQPALAPSELLPSTWNQNATVHRPHLGKPTKTIIHRATERYPSRLLINATLDVGCWHVFTLRSLTAANVL